MKNSGPKNLKPLPVTVIATVLNEAASIGALLDSLRHQTLKPTAVIIADGGSQDGTLNKLHEYQKAFPNFPLKILEQKGNRSLGRNAAITAATTNVIAITDAGVTAEPEWLAALIEKYQQVKAQSQDSEIIVAGYYRGDAKTEFERAQVPYMLVMPDKVNPDHFLPATRSMLLEKSAWEKVGKFDERWSLNEDYEFAKRAERQSDVKLAFTSEAIVAWQPRKTLKGFAVMVYRFAKGDTLSNIVRRKVLAIFGRYLLMVGVVIFGVMQSWGLELVTLGLISGFLYSLWAVLKNLKYVGQAWYWLPILQVVSDVMVMAGSLSGWWQRLRSAT